MSQAWRDEILEGLDHVPAKGAIDTLAVYGQNAEPILSGRMPHHVFMAAGKYGQGRLVVFSGRGFTSEMEKAPQNQEMAKFRQNILKWLRPGVDNHQVINITDTASIEIGQGHVLLWQVEHPRKSDKFIQDVKNFLQTGGGVIFTKTPSGYAWRHKSLSTSPIFQILHDAGIYFSLPRAGIKHHKKVVAENEAHRGHLGRAIDECLKNPRNLTKHGAVIAFGVESLPHKEDVKSQLRRLLDEIDNFDIRYIPQGPKKRVKTPEGINLAHFVHSFLWDPESGKAPGCDEFPGDFDIPPELACVDATLKSTTKTDVEAHPTGVYLPPGGTVKVEVIEGDPKGWKLIVGAHGDILDKKDQIKRWLKVQHKDKLISPVTEVFNPFGGLIYLKSPRRLGYLRLRISNVVESPFYDMRKEDCDETWKEVRQRPGLWADLKSHHMHITLPSSAIRDIKDVRPMMEFWDQVVQHLHDLRGSKAHTSRGQWVVADMQPGAGAMHSGYPIVTHLNVTEADSDNYILSTSPGFHWGIFHEMGHNLQRGAWTPNDHIEVTCNIFSIYGNFIMYGTDPWKVGWVERHKRGMKSFLETGVLTSSPVVRLAIYAQLARDFGFEAYKMVFRSYKKNKDSPKAHQEKVDLWVKKFSNAVGYNIAPAYDLWGMEASESIKRELQELTPYMPDDEVTQVAPDKVREIAAKYPGIVRHPSKCKYDTCEADNEEEEEDDDDSDFGQGHHSD